MQGRIDHKIEMERRIQDKIKLYPDYVTKFYYSLNQKSHTTKLRYILNVLRFLDSVKVDDLNVIDSYLIEQYMSQIDYYKEGNEMKELSNTTKACIYSSLNAFFTFLSNHGIKDDNPFDKKRIQRPRPEETEITFLTPEEVKKVEQQILDGIGNERAVGKQRNWKYRDLLLFRIPVINGLRVTALSEINVDDIDLVNKTIRVTEKGNVTKLIYLDDKTCMYIDIWLRDRRHLLKGVDNKAVFISNQKKRMTTVSIENVIKKYTEIIPDKHITPHKLRSTFGTNLYQQTKDIYYVANALGHKSTEPTRRYAKIFDQDRKNAVNIVANLYD